MSYTYISNRDPDAHDWMPNISGSQLLGWVHEATGAKLADTLTGPTDELTSYLKAEHAKAMELREAGEPYKAAIHYRPDHAYQATAAEAKEMAKVIRDNLDKLPPVFETWGKHLFSGTYDEFLAYVEVWCVWLEQSEGYECV